MTVAAQDVAVVAGRKEKVKIKAIRVGGETVGQ